MTTSDPVAPRTVLEGVDFLELSAMIDGLRAERDRYERLYLQAVEGRAAFRSAYRAALEREQGAAGGGSDCLPAAIIDDPREATRAMRDWARANAITPAEHDVNRAAEDHFEPAPTPPADKAGPAPGYWVQRDMQGRYRWGTGVPGELPLCRQLGSDLLAEAEAFAATRAHAAQQPATSGRGEALPEPDESSCTVDWYDEAHDGAGYYYVDDEYGDEGSCGAFATLAEALRHAAAQYPTIHVAPEASAKMELRNEGATPPRTRSALTVAADDSLADGYCDVCGSDGLTVRPICVGCEIPLSEHVALLARADAAEQALATLHADRPPLHRGHHASSCEHCGAELAELRGVEAAGEVSCWHCGDVLIGRVPRPRCEVCPEECDLEGCTELGCVDGGKAGSG